jgi:diguanylate cyclase (GGDEF)-like protein
MNALLEELVALAPLAAAVGIACVGILAAAAPLLALRLRAAERRIGELTLVDTLTGLGNRRLLELELPREIARARRARRWFFAAVADVDRLEPFNASAGRPAGHAVLAGIGSVLRSSLRRAGDHTFRSQGDRFLFAFTSEHKHDGAAMAERIRGRVAELGTFHPENPPHGFVTISVGLVVVSPDDTASLTAIEERAAEALSLARKEGRNRTAGLTLDGERVRTEDGLRITATPPPARGGEGR